MTLRFQTDCSRLPEPLSPTVLEERNKSLDLQDLAQNAAQSGKFDEAIETANKISRQALQEMTFDIIGRILIQPKNLDKAITYIAKFQSEGAKKYCLHEASKACIQVGNFDLALLIAELASSKRVKEHDFLTEISIGLAQTGDPHHIRRAISIATSLSEDGTSMKPRIFQSISISLTHAGDFKEARAIAMSINDEAFKNNALKRIDKAEAGAFNTDCHLVV